MTLLTKKNIYISNIIFILLLFTLPNGGSAIFNGLPWSNSYETLILIVYFPLIFFLLKSFFETKLSLYLIILALFLKLILIFYPSIGIGHNMYMDDDKKKLETYSNFWNDKYSIIQEYGWNEKDNFPLNEINFRDEYNNVMGNSPNLNENYNKLSLKTEVNFYLNYDEITNFKILFEGDINNSYIEYKPTNSEKYQNLQYDSESKYFFINEKKKYDNNSFHFRGTLHFNELKWKLTPYIIKDGKKISAFNEGVIFTNFNEYNFFSKIVNFKVFVLYEFIIYFIILLSLILLIYSIWSKNLINNEITFSIFFFISTVSFDFILMQLKYEILKINIYHKFWPLCISLIIFIFILLINNLFNLSLFKNIYKKPNQFLIILIYPTFAYIGFQYFNDDFLKTSYWAYGNDWLIFANASKKIVLDNEWILAGEKTFYFRPGIRYFYAISHVLFGESAFALKFIEYLLIFFISLLCFNIMKKLKIGVYSSVIFSLILLIFYIGESFRWLIGRGLSEFYGTFIIILMCYLFLDKKISYAKIFVLGILGIISCWLREEKLLLVLPLIFFIDSDKIIHNNFFMFIFYFFKNNYKKLILYWTIVILGFPILFEFRNYYLSNSFTIINHPNLYLAENSFKFHIIGFYEMILATPYNNFPRLIPIFTIPTFLLSLLIIFYPPLFRKFPYPALSIVILSIILPTFILHLTAYIPRHSIYLLPFSIMLFARGYESLKN